MGKKNQRRRQQPEQQFHATKSATSTSTTNGSSSKGTSNTTILTTLKKTNNYKEPQNPTSTTSTSTPTPTTLSSISLKKKFLTPEDGEIFETVLKNHYQGFVHVPVTATTPNKNTTNNNNINFHNKSKAILERLRDANYYQYDIVMAGGKFSSRTFVKRTLVGNPGITYKYLGLRLFAHSWSGPKNVCPPVMKAVGGMNQEMIEMTKQYPNHGRCDYNLTLINYMEPTSHTKIGFKEEANYGMGKVSVSWHADSSLELNSSIGVYHCLPTQKTSKWDWRIALRRSPADEKESNGNGGNRDDNFKRQQKQQQQQHILPVSVPTKDGDTYFLLGTFNETHQHCVIAGSEASRISSTHRVAVTQEDTYDYILRRVKGGSKRFKLELQKATNEQKNNNNPKNNTADINIDIDPRVVVHCQKILTQVEMEWIAQYWLQGAEHDKMHIWWQKPMKTLEAYWAVLEEMTLELYNLIVSRCRKQPQNQKQSNNNNDNNNNMMIIKRSVIEGFLEELKLRQEQRIKWDERRADKIYQRRITPPFRPVARPDFEGGKGLGKDLTNAINELTTILSQMDEDSKSPKGGNSIIMSTNDNNNNNNTDSKKKKKKKKNDKSKEGDVKKEDLSSKTPNSVGHTSLTTSSLLPNSSTNTNAKVQPPSTESIKNNNGLKRKATEETNGTEGSSNKKGGKKKKKRKKTPLQKVN